MTKKVLSDADFKAIGDLIKVKVEEVLEEKKVITQDDIKHLPTKKEFYERMDKLTGELETYRQERVVEKNQSSLYDERINALENIHPQGKHSLRHPPVA